MNEKFLQSVRHHTELIETTASHQIVNNCHGFLDFSYAWSQADADKTKKILHQIYPEKNDDSVTIHCEGEFIPHYNYEQQ